MSTLDDIKNPFSNMSQEELFKVMEQLARIIYQKKDVEIHTELNVKQIGAIMQIEHDDYHLKHDWGINLHLTNLVTQPKKIHNISKNRSSRGEFVELFKNLFDKVLHRGVGERLLGTSSDK